MDKMNKNFKILTKEETSEVKGGGWLLTNLLDSVYNKYEAIKAAFTDGSCPPPEPDRD